VSLARVCDCPCHEFDEVGAALIEEFEQWNTFGGKDVCQRCLAGTPYCMRWQPRVKQPLTATQENLRDLVQTAYNGLIEDSLRSSQPLFRLLKGDS
jgi:hypothetical protein